MNGNGHGLELSGRATPPLVELTGLEYRYEVGQPPVLRIPAWSLTPGRCVAIVGGNGSGKTTLLHLLALLRQPTRGKMHWRGADPWQTGLLAARRQVSLVEQAPYMLRRSIAGNLTFPDRCLGRPRNERPARVEQALAAVGLQGQGARFAPHCSGGEQKRIALARALVLQPELLLVDEPVAFLDEQSSRQVELLLLDWPRGGRTLIFTAHQAPVAFRLTQHVWELAEGQLRQLRPVNRFHGHVTVEDGVHRFCIGEVRLTIPPGHERATALHLPPHDILLSFEPVRTSAQNCLPGRITRLRPEPPGSCTAWVDVGLLLEVRLTEISRLQLGLAEGQGVYVTFKASSLRLS